MEVTRASYSEPEPQPQQMLSRTPDSELVSELSKIIDVVIAGRYQMQLKQIGTLHFRWGNIRCEPLPYYPGALP